MENLTRYFEKNNKKPLNTKSTECELLMLNITDTSTQSDVEIYCAVCSLTDD